MLNRYPSEDTIETRLKNDGVPPPTRGVLHKTSHYWDRSNRNSKKSQGVGRSLLLTEMEKDSCDLGHVEISFSRAGSAVPVADLILYQVRMKILVKLRTKRL